MASDDPSTWRLTTNTGIKYRRLSHEGTMSYDAIGASEEYLIQTSDLEKFLRDFIPAPKLVNGIPIYSYYKMPGTVSITPSSINWKSWRPGIPIDPFGADPGARDGTYSDLTHVTVKYDDSADKPGDNTSETPDPSDPTTFLEISGSASGEFLHVPSTNNSYWLDGANREQNSSMNVPSTIIIPQTEWTLTWPRVTNRYFAEVFINRLRSIMGKVNQGPYSLLFNASAETLLFVGWSMTEERQFLFDSERGNLEIQKNPVKLDLKILEKRIPLAGGGFGGHQHFWRPDARKWQKLLKSDSANDFVYETYDYNTLFATS